MVRLIRDGIGTHSRIVHVPPVAVRVLSRLLGLAVGDVLLTRHELDGMMAGLVDTSGPATAATALSQWVSEHRQSLGQTYASELERHFTRDPAGSSAAA